MGWANKAQHIENKYAWKKCQTLLRSNAVFVVFGCGNVASGNVQMEEAVENQAQRWFEKPFSCCIALQTAAFSSEQPCPTRGRAETAQRGHSSPC
jgi:hypothetical protein